MSTNVRDGGARSTIGLGSPMSTNVRGVAWMVVLGSLRAVQCTWLTENSPMSTNVRGVAWMVVTIGKSCVLM